MSVISQPIVMLYAILYGSENTKHKYVSEYNQIAFVTCSRYWEIRVCDGLQNNSQNTPERCPKNEKNEDPLEGRKIHKHQ